MRRRLGKKTVAPLAVPNTSAKRPPLKLSGRPAASTDICANSPPRGAKLTNDAPPGAAARSTRLAKHSLVVCGHRTSLSLEDAFWMALKEIASRRRTSLAKLVSEIDAQRADANLSSALRVFVLNAIRLQNGPAESGSDPNPAGAERAGSGVFLSDESGGAAGQKSESRSVGF